MPSRKKIDLQKVMAALHTTCPTCGRVIEPAEIQRVNFEEMISPECGGHFDVREMPSRVPDRRWRADD
jgi:predicted RNA-binding Zn-ribbon protein involved in translation (DUF1610 family)